MDSKINILLFSVQKSVFTNIITRHNDCDVQYISTIKDVDSKTFPNNMTIFVSPDKAIVKDENIDIFFKLKKNILNLEIILFGRNSSDRDKRFLKYDLVNENRIENEINRRIKKINIRNSKIIKNSKQDFQFKGTSKAIQEIRTNIKHISRNDRLNCLITGESGTGKEILALDIFNKSIRNTNRFVPVNCSAIPPNLVESELFGHEPHSFSNAAPKGKTGFFEEADDGFLFLDEIGELPYTLQAKLLRALEEKEIFKVGALKPIPINVRVIAATNANLNILIEEGKFRNDLFHRICHDNLQIPPLRQRPEDIKFFFNYYLEKVKKRENVIPGKSAEFLAELIDYSFPGNVRELKNLVEKNQYNEEFILDPGMQSAIEKDREYKRLKSIREDSLNRDLFLKTKMLKEVNDEIINAAENKLTRVIIYGEPGTMKELVARQIHKLSNNEGPFVVINCSQIPQDQIESVIFGSLVNSNGNVTVQVGLIQQGDGGTVLIHEIDKLALPIQTKLIDVCDRMEITRCGDNKIITVRVRIIVSSTKDLIELCNKNLFRAELFYRLSDITFLIKPLRKKKSDILLLANHFIEHYSLLWGIEKPNLSPEGLKKLKDYDFPGNVSELDHVIRKSLARNRKNKKLDIIDFIKYKNPPEELFMTTWVKLDEEHTKIKTKILLKTYQDNNYDLSKTAEALETTRDKLYYFAKKNNILHLISKNLNSEKDKSS